MSGQPAEFSVQRVVVALESICENLPALEQAAELARRANARLHALFIEDTRLLDVAALPFTRQINLSSGGSAPLEPDAVKAEFSALAGRARRCLEELAARLKVPCSFEILRGNRAGVLAAAAGGDLLVVETSTRAVGRHLRLKTDWFGALAESGHPCLLLGPSEHRARDRGQDVLVLEDGTPAGARARAAADLLGRIDHNRIVIAQPRDLSTSQLRQAIAEAGCGLLVAPAALVARHRAALEEFLAAPACALLLVA
jgi:hypothetical protein